MSREEKDKRFIKRMKVVILVFGLLSLVNIVILIGRNQSYALFRRHVQSKRVIEIHVAKEFPGVYTLKSKLGDGGLVGIPTNCSEESCEPITDKSVDKSTIREYRYSGLGVKNYVKFNDELWIIIGIFKNEDGEEHMKIVRNETLDGIPSSYTVDGKTFNLYGGTTSRWDTDSEYDNNWADAGLMNWLNSKGTTDGYLKTLTSTAQEMIEETKWYLGTLKFDTTNFLQATVAEAYKHERAVEGCVGNNGSSDNNNSSAVETNSTCRVWANNASYWEGNIALMYPSDLGYTVDSQYWTNTMINSKGFTSTIVETSWLFKETNHSVYEWFLSPTSDTSEDEASWNPNGYVAGGRADAYREIRPTLYLKSNIKITSGYGTLNQPYELQLY